MTSGQPDYAGTVLGPSMVPATYERRTIIFNDNRITEGEPPSNRSADDYGKFFTRGMRGTIEEILVYAKGDGADTVVLNISPQPGLGPLHSETFTPPSGWSWNEVAFNVMWNYDSLYVWISDIEAEVFWGYDELQPYDGHLTDDDGATFADVDERPYIRVVMTGETAGDVPVSGTVTAILLPSSSSAFERDDEAVPAGVETDLIEVEGAGFCDFIEVKVDAATGSHNTQIFIYCDGVLALAHGLSWWGEYGVGDSTPTVSLLSYSANGLILCFIHKRFNFRRSLKLTAKHASQDQTVSSRAYPTLLR